MLVKHRIVREGFDWAEAGTKVSAEFGRYEVLTSLAAARLKMR